MIFDESGQEPLGEFLADRPVGNAGALCVSLFVRAVRQRQLSVLRERP